MKGQRDWFPNRLVTQNVKISTGSLMEEIRLIVVEKIVYGDQLRKHHKWQFFLIFKLNDNQDSDARNKMDESSNEAVYHEQKSSDQDLE